jgi:hypothetical protein
MHCSCVERRDGGIGHQNILKIDFRFEFPTQQVSVQDNLFLRISIYESLRPPSPQIRSLGNTANIKNKLTT